MNFLKNYSDFYIGTYLNEVLFDILRMAKEDKNRKKKRFQLVLILAIILVVVILVLVLAYIYSLIKEKEIKLGENIVEVSLNENKTEAYLKIENINESVLKIKFVFVDDKNERHSFETSTIENEFRISAGDAGLENFKDIENVSAIFSYEEIENPLLPEDEEEDDEEIEIPIEDCIPKTCSEMGKECESWTEDRCNIVINCPSCETGKKCERGSCINENCTDEAAEVTCANNACGIKKNNCSRDVNCSLVNPATCSICIPASKETTCGSWVCGDKINDCGTNVDCGGCNSGYDCINGKCEEITTPNCPRAKCYYVATSGNDGNDGTETSPFKTLDKAESVARENEGVVVRAGNYEVTNPIFPKSGQYWKSYNGERVYIKGTKAQATFDIEEKKNIVIDGFILDEAWKSIIRAFNSTNISVLNSVIFDWDKSNTAYYAGIKYVATTYSRIANNEFYSEADSTSNATAAIEFTGSHATGLYGTGGNIVENNYIHGDKLDNGIWGDVRAGSPFFKGGLNIWRNNIIENVGGNGFRLETGSSALIYNNIIINPGNSGFAFRSCTDIVNTVVKNNVVYNPGYFGINIDDSPHSDSGADSCDFTNAKHINLTVKNNIIYMKKNIVAIKVDEHSANEPLNIFSNNLIYSTSGTQAICWGQPITRGTTTCLTPSTGEGNAELYTSTQLNQFHTAHKGCCSKWGDPLFVDAASKDFHLKLGSPGCHTGDGGVNVGAYPDTGC